MLSHAHTCTRARTLVLESATLIHELTHKTLSSQYFDLAPTKALARWEGDGLVVEALPSFVESLRTMSFHFDIMSLQGPTCAHKYTTHSMRQQLRYTATFLQ